MAEISAGTSFKGISGPGAHDAVGALGFGRGIWVGPSAPPVQWIGDPADSLDEDSGRRGLRVEAGRPAATAKIQRALRALPFD